MQQRGISTFCEVCAGKNIHCRMICHVSNVSLGCTQADAGGCLFSHLVHLIFGLEFDFTEISYSLI